LPGVDAGWPAEVETEAAGVCAAGRVATVWCEHPLSAKTQSAVAHKSRAEDGNLRRNKWEEMFVRKSCEENFWERRLDSTQLPDGLVCSHLLRVL
jgi:hypothetical protein